MNEIEEITRRIMDAIDNDAPEDAGKAGIALAGVLVGSLVRIAIALERIAENK